MAKKYVIVVGDGMGDYPLEELGVRTPLEVAKTPTIDLIAGAGEMGIVRTIPDGMAPGSDVANMSILGYDPRGVLTGRGPLEAAAMGIELGKYDVAFRCNLVTIGYEGEEAFMKDYSAGHISTEESHEIIKDLQKATKGLPLRLYPGVSYRHVLVWRGGIGDIETTPPHDITGKPIKNYAQVYEKIPVLRDFIRRSEEILSSHKVNQQRILKGLNPANSVWPWGQGSAPEISSIKDRCGLKGVMITAVDLLKGIGFYAGFEIPSIKGATGYLDTNYQGKVDTALKYLETVDIAYIHIEAPDETSHEGNVKKKIQAIEDIDGKVLKPLLDYFLKSSWQVDLLFITDHLTPIVLKTHVSDPVPFLLVRDVTKKIKGEEVKASKYCERVAFEKQGDKEILHGWELFSYFVGC